MKILRNIVAVAIIALIILTLSSNVLAADLKTTLNVIQQSSEIKYLENDQGFISKSIVDSNKDTGEVTIELKLSNTKKDVDTTTDTEIFLVVDNSPSMDFVTSTGKTRKELVLNSASKLVTSIFDTSSKVKIGLIDFHGHTGGIFGEAASIYNATVRQKLTDDKDTVLSAITTQLNRSTVSGTNIQAGLETAKKNFSSSENNKIVILLTDGIPNADINGNVDKDNPNDVTTETNITIAQNTKNTLLELKKAGIYTITLLTGMSETDGNTDKEGNEYTDNNTIEEQLAAAESIFGTESNPTADKYYLVSNLNINEIITKDILRDVKNKIQNPINTVKMVDYFPKDITDNFEFSYVGKPSIGTASESIDNKNNTIEWNVGTLKGDEVATLKYKLKIKDMKNTNLLNKTISTNEKVVLTYKDTDSKDYTVTLSSSPKIQLSEVKEESTNTKKDNPVKENTVQEKPVQENSKEKDNTIASATLPKAGKSVVIVALALVVLLVLMVAYFKYNKLKDIK